MVLSQRRALILGTAAAILLLGAILLIGVRRRAMAQAWVEHTHTVLRTTELAVAGLVTAESGQRGYLLTGLDRYLAPYRSGLQTYDSAMTELRRLTADNAGQRRNLDVLAGWVERRREVLDRTLQVRRTQGLEAAMSLFQTSLGKDLMDSVRQSAANLERDELALLAERQEVETRRERGVFLLAGLATIAGVVLVLIQGGLLSRAVRVQEQLTSELADRAKTLEETAAELEFSNEELQSSNEELQTASEELESTNWSLEQAAARFRILVETLPAPLVVCRPSGETTYVNPAWVALTGIPAATAVAEGWASTVHPEERQRVAAAWPSVLEGNRVELSYRHLRPDGAVRHVRTIFEPVKSAAGQTTDVLGMGLDLTERLEHEEQLRHAQRMQAVGRLAGGMAHELNNMLTASIGFAIYAMRRLPADHPASPDISESLKAQERAARITSQVLSFSRRQMLAPVRFDLREALEDLLPLLRQSLEPDQAVVMDLAATGVAHVDRTRLDQAIINLTLNARDAMASGGTLTVGTRRTTLAAGALIGPEGERVQPGDYLIITLTDNGSGMDDEVRRRALEPFFTTKAVGQGTGLGLSMAYGFVRQSGGTLTIESEAGGGTSVSLYLPLVAEAILEEPETLRPERVMPARGERVLIVDDEPSVRGAMRRALEDKGYRVIEAVSGADALGHLDTATGEVHLVVCDLVMPNMTGENLGKAIGRRWPHLPVLYVSGFPGADGDEGMMPAGAPFLKKPFSPQDFARRVRELLERG